MKKPIFRSINKALFFATAISVSAITPIYSAHADYSVHADNSMETAQVSAKQTYLGIAIDKVPLSLQQQLGSILPKNQGILIQKVVDGSPAQTAQLHAYDILTSYNEQKLFTPKQLTQLVRSTKNGEQVNLTIIRNGQTQTIPVTIGEQTIAANNTQHHPMHHPMHKPGHNPRHNRHGQHHAMQQAKRHHDMPFDSMMMPDFKNKVFGNQLFGNASTKNWDSFQSLSLEKLKDNQYKAAIEFLDKKGNKQRFQFQGSRADIQEQLQQHEQLPHPEKQQLLNLLGAN